eukprot:345539_1
MKECVILNEHSSRRRENVSSKSKTHKSQIKIDVRMEILVASLNSLHSYLIHTDLELYRLRNHDVDAGLRFVSQKEILNDNDDDNKDDCKNDNESKIHIDILNNFLLNYDMDNKDVHELNTWYHDNAYDSDSLYEDIIDGENNSNIYNYLKQNKTNKYFDLITEKYIKKEEKVEHKEFQSINFGVSALRWLEWNEIPKYRNLKTELLSNKYTTLDAELYENYKQQALIKMANHSHEFWSLNEMLSLKIYTDATKFQAVFRKSFWRIKNDDKSDKKEFYWWSMTLYSASLYHALPIPRISKACNDPCKIFHGLNNVFIVDEQVPVYNGAISTTLAQNVAHQFSEGAGLLWTIEPSYSNPFCFIVGIQVDWISQFKNEAEILLVNQYLPICETVNFEKNISNQVDQIISQLIKYKHKITSKKRFYKQIGFQIKNDWVSMVQLHSQLFDKSKYQNQFVIQRFVEEFKLEQLRDMWSAVEDLYVLTDEFMNNLVLEQNNKIISLNAKSIDEKNVNGILENEYLIANNLASQLQMVKNIDENHTYQFSNINNVHFLVPCKLNTDNIWSIYVKINNMSKYVRIKTFTIKQTYKYTNNTYKNKAYKMNYLLDMIKIYRFKISDPKLFYHRIDSFINDDNIPLIMQSGLLFQPTVVGSGHTFLYRLIKELNVKQIEYLWAIYAAKLQYTYINTFDCCIFEIDLSTLNASICNDFMITYELRNGNNARFKYDKAIALNNSFTKNKSFMLCAANYKLFGTNDYIPIHRVPIPTHQVLQTNKKKRHLTTKKIKKTASKYFVNNLILEDAQIIILNSKKVNKKHYKAILSSKYSIICTKNALIDEIKTHSSNIYEFNDIDDINFVIPYIPGTTTCGVYVQPKHGLNYVLIQTFSLEDRQQNEDAKIDYLLNVLKSWNSKTNTQAFFERIGFSIESNHIPLIDQKVNQLKDIDIMINKLNITQLLFNFNLPLFCNALEIQNVVLTTFNCKQTAILTKTNYYWYFEVKIIKSNASIFIGWVDEKCDGISWKTNGIKALKNETIVKDGYHNTFWRNGDVVRCYIDIERKTIGYCVNAGNNVFKDLGILFKNIECVNRKISPTISMLNGEKVEITSKHQNKTQYYPSLFENIVIKYNCKHCYQTIEDKIQPSGEYCHKCWISVADKTIGNTKLKTLQWVSSQKTNKECRFKHEGCCVARIHVETFKLRDEQKEKMNKSDFIRKLRNDFTHFGSFVYDAMNQTVGIVLITQKMRKPAFICLKRRLGPIDRISRKKFLLTARQLEVLRSPQFIQQIMHDFIHFAKLYLYQDELVLESYEQSRTIEVCKKLEETRLGTLWTVEEVIQCMRDMGCSENDCESRAEQLTFLRSMVRKVSSGARFREHKKHGK